MKPVSMFFLANLIYFLIPTFNTFNTTLDTQLSSFNHSALANRMVEKEMNNQGLDIAEYREIYNNKTNELSKLFLIFMSAIFGFLFWPIHLGTKKKLFADHLTLGLEVMTFIILSVMSIAIVSSLFSFFGFNIASELILSTTLGLLLLFFLYVAEKQFYGFRGFRRIINTIFCFLSVVISLALYRKFLFFITFWSV